ncbi:cytochrome b reductase [Thecamonas trahens ATCC 50062]|uniref:Cytochrome b reductase n=1 Tax=Thecamonas trahens ATCC 50062 TaxID=461836 RepID=A0A0L0D6G0_THETB|nr:cytochrome b reductase [Thecamonas trahens ATCC 50062]KNC47939.1 cytochrome b reductase [Thecamonas trahens ATCC 50062]|eukprot:XP_013758958.1 cytochrome b reductase [Thecamonas trahens ATCC 50062]
MDWLHENTPGASALAGAAAAVAGVASLAWLLTRRQTARPPALDPKQARPLTVVATRMVTHNVVEVEIALPEEDDVTGLALGQHVGVVYTPPDATEPVRRSYTPISPLSATGSFTLAVKVYPDGVVSSMLANLDIGDTVLIRGPVGRWTYPTNEVQTLVMIAGGSGITPMFQLLSELLDAPSPTRLVLVYANSTPEDVILYQHIVDLAQAYPDKLEISLWVSRTSPGATWAHNIGRLNAARLAAVLPPATSPGVLITYSGPPSFNKMVGDAVKELGFRRPHVHRF